jgi:hypothetical protein
MLDKGCRGYPFPKIDNRGVYLVQHIHMAQRKEERKE